MERKNGFARFFVLFCIYFTAISVVILTVELLIAGDFDNTNVDVARFLLLLPLSACLAFGNFLLRTPYLHKVVKVICHCILVVVSCFLFLYLPLGNTAERNLYFILIALVLYALCYGVCLLVRKIKKNQSIKNSSVNKKN